jgi:hypothetical protein
MMWKCLARLLAKGGRGAPKRVRVEIPLELHKSSTELYNNWIRGSAGRSPPTNDAPKAREDGKDS